MVANQEVPELTIDRTKEKLLSFVEVTKLAAQEGRKMGLPTVYRWATKGLLGVKLEHIFILNRAYTSVEALERFDARLTAAKLAKRSAPKPSKPATPRAVAKAHAAAKARLAG